MTAPTVLSQRQEDLGPAGWFSPQAANPPANQVVVAPGIAMVGAFGEAGTAPFTQQTTAGFSVVSSGFQRYDLVYIDRTGTVQILQGTAVAAGSPAFQGAPGWTGTNPGPLLPDQALPVAWVLVNETASVIVAQTDITQINGFLKLSRDLMGFFVDKGNTPSVPAAGSQVVTSDFTGEVAGGGNSAPGIITTPTLNVVGLLDQNGNQIQENVTGNGHEIYGRITFSASVWTLSYFYENDAGVETAITNMTTQSVVTLTAIHMASVPKVYSLNDPNRPLFAAGAITLGKVAGEIPFATTSSPGIVLALATSPSDVTAGHVVQANDARLGTIEAELDGGGTVGKAPLINFVEGTNVTMTVALVGGVITVTINSTASGSFPGFGGTPPADTPGGSSGGSGTASRSDHAHPLSTDYAETFSGIANGSGNSWTTSCHNPRFAVGLGEDGTASTIGVAFGLGGSTPTQASSQGGSSTTYSFGSFFHTTGSSVSFTAWTTTSQTLSGTGSWNVTYFVFGQTSL